MRVSTRRHSGATLARTSMSNSSFTLAATLLALNFLGDGLRDALDPRMRKD